MSTKSDLLNAWTKWTGDDVAETRHRIRTLSEAGLLPSRKQPLSYTDIARAILGFVTTTQHKDAPEAVNYYSEFRCHAHEWLKGELNADWPPADPARRLTDLTLLEALAISLQQPLWINTFNVNLTTNTCGLTVGSGYRYFKTKSGKEAISEINSVHGIFRHKYNAPALMYFRVSLSRSISYLLIEQLLRELMNHPESPRYGRIARADPADISDLGPIIPTEKRRSK
jgi:hypothetical protein